MSDGTDVRKLPDEVLNEVRILKAKGGGYVVISEDEVLLYGCADLLDAVDCAYAVMAGRWSDEALARERARLEAAHPAFVVYPSPEAVATIKEELAKPGDVQPSDVYVRVFWSCDGASHSGTLAQYERWEAERRQLAKVPKRD